MEAAIGLKKLEFEETKLRLGLPDHDNYKVMPLTIRKRGFSQASRESGENTDEQVISSTSPPTPTVDLTLNLISSTDHTICETQNPNTVSKDKITRLPPSDLASPPPKAQVVGWPPVRSFRKNMLTVKKSNLEVDVDNGTGATAGNGSATFVKVSMDGAPYLRKVDLKMYKSYQELSDALGQMFSSFTIGNCGSQGIMKDFMNESKLMDLLNSSDYVPTYEDKDGDWMLVGDVPWEMFVESCKRLRIMKGKEAIGLAPRAMKKCKNRS